MKCAGTEWRQPQEQSVSEVILVANVPSAHPGRSHRASIGRWPCRGPRLERGHCISHLRDLLGDLVDCFALLPDHMLLNLADIGVDLTQDVILRLRQLPQLREQGVLPGGDAVHPSEAARTRSYPCQPVRNGRVIHSHLPGSWACGPYAFQPTLEQILVVNSPR